MSTIVFAWVNATTRKDGALLAAVGSSIISLINADKTVTPVATVTGDGTSETIPAPTVPGTYNYQVQNVDVNGVVGDPLEDVAPVVIPEPVDSSPPVAPTDFTATLTADVETSNKA